MWWNTHISHVVEHPHNVYFVRILESSWCNKKISNGQLNVKVFNFLFCQKRKQRRSCIKDECFMTFLKYMLMNIS